MYTENLRLPNAEGAFGAWPDEVGPSAAAFYLRWGQAPFVPWGAATPYENLYPLKIEELYLRNAYFRRITDEKAEQIKGEGLVVEGPQGSALQTWMRNTGINDALLEAAAYDLALFNGFALQVIWNRGRSRVVQLVPQKIASLRAAKPDAQGQVAGYYLSADWAVIDRRGRPRQRRFEAYAPVLLPVYDPARPEGRQLVYAAKFSPVSEFYPLPEAESVFEELSLANDVVGFQRRYVQNGMVSSAIVYVPFTPESTLPGGELSENDKRRMDDRRRQIVDDLTGNLRAGQLSIVWFNPHLADRNGNPIGVPRIERPVEERNDQKFIEVQRESRQSFLTGLGVVSPELYGIPSASGFSSQSDLLLTANELSYQKIIRPKQQVLLRTLRMLARDAGFTDAQISIANPLPVHHLLTPEMVKAGIFTADEFRESYGYPPMGKQTLNAEGE